MPNKRDDTKSELEIIIEKLDLIIEQTKPQKTSSSSLTNYDAIGNEMNKVLANARDILSNQPKFNFDSTTNPHLQHNLGDTE